MAGLRSAVDGNFIRIELDEPYQKTYQLDYLSLARRATSETSIATNVFDVNVANGTNSGGSSNGNGGSASENNSTSKVSGNSEADLWSEVGKSVAQILASTSRKTDKDPTGPNFSMDKQAGLVTVYGDSRQQAAIDAYFVKLRRKANAQVLIDARIIEVELSDAFKSGINWSTLFSRGLNLGATFTPPGLSPSNLFTASASASDFSGILKLVRTFGATRVLSSPRLTVLNNQTAILKVATNQVYFVTQAQFTTVTNANGSTVTTTPIYTSTPHTVPVGLVMTVQPAIDADHGRVTMTLRPTISRIVSEVNDPSIGLNAAQAGVANPVQSQIPVLAVREMDSVIRLKSGEVAVMGGLMQDSSINQDQGLPPFDTLPIVGTLAKSRDNAGTTTELVILLRATIADTPAPDNVDSDLYEHFGKDPRQLPTRPRRAKSLPLPDPPAFEDVPSDDAQPDNPPDTDDASSTDPT
jgi:general secretion pathway protein D